VTPSAGQPSQPDMTPMGWALSNLLTAAIALDPDMSQQLYFIELFVALLRCALCLPALAETTKECAVHAA